MEPGRHRAPATAAAAAARQEAIMTPPALDPESFRRLAHAAVDLVADYLASIRTRPVFQPMAPDQRAALIQEPLGEAGACAEAILEHFRTAVLPHAMGNGHPRFFGWVNSPPAPIGIVADFLAAALNPSCAGGDHAATYADRAAVRRPFCVAASAGAVSTGAIDPLDALADLCAAERLWLHVDGAYGAVGAAVPSRRARYAGLARADSVALDPHKWLSVPAECGAVLVRDGRLLREAFSLVPAYLRTEPDRGFGGLPWYSEYGIQQTRGFRALKLWMTLQHLGRDGVRDLVARHLALAAHLARLVDAAPDLERLAALELPIVCFRYAPGRLRGDHRAL